MSATPSTRWYVGLHLLELDAPSTPVVRAILGEDEDAVSETEPDIDSPTTALPSRLICLLGASQSGSYRETEDSHL